MRTRLTPTPSGYLHLGNAFNFLTTALVAHLAKADIMLRIDDLDQPRYRQEYAQDIFDVIHWLGIEYQLGPANVEQLEQEWSQQYRAAKYEQALQKLIEQDLVYACNCSRKQILEASAHGAYTGTCRNKGLALHTPGASWRLKTTGAAVSLRHWPKGEQSVFSFPANMKDFVVRRRDGLVAYQLASLVDDQELGVDLMVRGVDLLDSSIAQIYLAECLGFANFKESLFFHHRLLQREGVKLSKSVLQSGQSLTQQYSPQEVLEQYAQFIGYAGPHQNFTELKEGVRTELLSAQRES